MTHIKHRFHDYATKYSRAHWQETKRYLRKLLHRGYQPLYQRGPVVVERVSMTRPRYHIITGDLMDYHACNYHNGLQA